MTAPRLTIAGARKRFGGVHALRGVDLEVAAGEVHALLGENGAGKSTLMKVLSGAVRPDEGHMTLDGAPFAPTGPRDARRSGVAMIYQELNLCADLSVLENVTLGEETARAGVVQSAGQRARRASFTRPRPRVMIARTSSMSWSAASGAGASWTTARAESSACASG